jgi:N-acetyltransferase
MMTTNLWTDIPTLQGEYVTLRPMVRDDGPAIVEAASDGRLWELFYTHVPSSDEIETWLNTALEQQDFGRSMPFVVIDKRDGQLVGSTRYLRMNKPALRLEIGATFYAQSVQRSRINSECKLLLLSRAFEVMGCQCVQIRTDYFNFASQRAIERLGAKRDGILRNHAFIRGRMRDLVVYSILAHEWKGVKRNLQMRLMRGA